MTSFFQNAMPRFSAPQQVASEIRTAVDFGIDLPDDLAEAAITHIDLVDAAPAGLHVHEAVFDQRGAFVAGAGVAAAGDAWSNWVTKASDSLSTFSLLMPSSGL